MPTHPAGHPYDADSLPPCPKCGRLQWVITRENTGWEAACLCGYVAYQSDTLPLVRLDADHRNRRTQHNSCGS